MTHAFDRLIAQLDAEEYESADHQARAIDNTWPIIREIQQVGYRSGGWAACISGGLHYWDKRIIHILKPYLNSDEIAEISELWPRYLTVPTDRPGWVRTCNIQDVVAHVAPTSIDMGIIVDIDMANHRCLPITVWALGYLSYHHVVNYACASMGRLSWITRKMVVRYAAFWFIKMKLILRRRRRRVVRHYDAARTALSTVQIPTVLSGIVQQYVTSWRV